MKKILLLFLLVIASLTLTGCGKNYDLKCSGNKTMTTDVCSVVSKSPNGKEETHKIQLCGDEETGEGTYYFTFEDDKVLVSFEEIYTELYTEEYYSEMEEHLSEIENCTLDKKNSRAIFKCTDYEISDMYKEYNTKAKLKRLMEKDLGYICY